MTRILNLCAAFLLWSGLAATRLWAQAPGGAPQDEFVPIDQLPPQEQLPAAPLLIAAYVFVLIVLFVYVFSLARRLSGVQQQLERLEQDSRKTGSR